MRYCKSTIFQANHNQYQTLFYRKLVVCDTAKVRFFKQITTMANSTSHCTPLFAILQKYDFSSKSQPIERVNSKFLSCLRYCKSTIFQANHNKTKSSLSHHSVVCDTAKVRFFKQITTYIIKLSLGLCCLRYCKSTIFQANHNKLGVKFQEPKLFAILQKYDFSSKSQPVSYNGSQLTVVCDTAKVRFFKQITTMLVSGMMMLQLFAILQKYDFSSKSQRSCFCHDLFLSCLRYCKSTIFQANHNLWPAIENVLQVVCDTAKVRFFKQITTYYC